MSNWLPWRMPDRWYYFVGADGFLTQQNQQLERDITYLTERIQKLEAEKLLWPKLAECQRCNTEREIAAAHKIRLAHDRKRWWRFWK